MDMVGRVHGHRKHSFYFEIPTLLGKTGAKRVKVDNEKEKKVYNGEGHFWIALLSLTNGFSRKSGPWQY